jgi:ferric-dicitrate binding protein FerR (iron transport regulator)
MNEIDVWELVVKKHYRTISLQESERLNNWLLQNPANRELADAMTQVLSQTSNDEEQFKFNAKTAWPNVERRISSKSNVRYLIPSMLRWAAAAVLIVGLASIAYWQVREPSQVIQQITISTKVGESKKIVLADGTRVWMNENSSLTFPKEFTDDTIRSVRLNGEAFLEVTHNPQKPFLVKGKYFETRVLGTSFNIQLTEHESSLLVVTGKVRFSSKENGKVKSSVVVERGFQAIASLDHELMMSQTLNQNKLAWHTGVLEFKNQKLTEVISELSSYYHKSIKINVDRPDDYLFTGAFNQTSAENALETICYSLHLRWKKTTQGYLISKD